MYVYRRRVLEAREKGIGGGARFLTMHESFDTMNAPRHAMNASCHNMNKSCHAREAEVEQEFFVLCGQNST